jgi:hypothetical protein
MRWKDFVRPIIAIGTLMILSGIAFFFFPGRFPHPEDFSPWGYLAAFLLALFAISRLAREERKRWYWAYAFICLFLGLEEISFGVENEWFQPIYWAKYDLTIYDIHNLIPAFLRILASELEVRTWDEALFAVHLLLDGGLILAVITIASGVGLVFKRSGISAAQRFSWTLIAALMLVSSLVGLSSLSQLPSDPKNALIAGYSLARLMPMLLMVAWILIVALAVWKWFSTAQSGDPPTINTWSGLLKNGSRIAALILALGGLAQLISPINANEQQMVLLERVMPILYWGIAQATLVWVLIKVQDEAFIGGLLELPKRIFGALQAHPSGVFMITALGLVAFAQLIDKDWLSVDQLFASVDFWVENWSLYIEEFFEASGGILLAAGTFWISNSIRKD